ncbi:MAG TPA: NAD(P)-dependent alcohol dehydrogenase [Novosphingobium sp.]|nr:NAD(P)-dependent alcohol dehydrogenase [Novosphingobium sp.]
MQITAALAVAPGAPFELAELELAAPGPGEVLVRIAGVGLCHTDLVFRDQFIPYPLPAVLGHEGAGVVAALGPDVQGLAVGDTVVLGFASCGACPRCAQQLPSCCREFVARNYAGVRPCGTSPLSLHGVAVAGAFFGQSSFASHALVNWRNVVRVEAGADLALLGPLGCGLQTGAGAVLRAMDCPVGSTLVVFGGGPVGLAGVMAARYRGCAQIVLAEPLAARRALALELGASHVLDPAAGDMAAQIRQILPDGADFVLETSGREAVVAEAMACLASHGTLGLVGVPARADSTLAVNLAGLITHGHRIMGIVEGDSDLFTFIPELVALYRAGHFPFDRLIQTFPLAEINAAIAAQHRGDCVKAVLLP